MFENDVISPSFPTVTFSIYFSQITQNWANFAICSEHLRTLNIKQILLHRVIHCDSMGQAAKPKDQQGSSRKANKSSKQKDVRGDENGIIDNKCKQNNRKSESKWTSQFEGREGADRAKKQRKQWMKVFRGLLQLRLQLILWRQASKWTWQWLTKKRGCSMRVN